MAFVDFPFDRQTGNPYKKPRDIDNMAEPTFVERLVVSFQHRLPQAYDMMSHEQQTINDRSYKT